MWKKVMFNNTVLNMKEDREITEKFFDGKWVLERKGESYYGEIQYDTRGT